MQRYYESMIKRLESILIGSEDAKALAQFYAEKVGLNLNQEMVIGEEDEEGYEFELPGGGIYILDHSEVKGKSTQPARIILNLEVDNMDEEVKRLDEAGVKKIQETYHMEGYGLITTYEDIDGNYFQLVQVKSE